MARSSPQLSAELAVQKVSFLEGIVVVLGTLGSAVLPASNLFDPLPQLPSGSGVRRPVEMVEGGPQ